AVAMVWAWAAPASAIAAAVVVMNSLRIVLLLVCRSGLADHWRSNPARRKDVPAPPSTGHHFLLPPRREPAHFDKAGAA
ncbi:MAG: hypothetical protein NZ734_05975, partial [Paracoccus sp.]|nr:hypothetical protein [Paracoccus sp. (in: a-proteobacteria)]